MSGGSYNYLCRKSIDEILVGGRADLQEMADRLAKLGYADDAARETQNLMQDIRAFLNRTESAAERLSEVWKNVEWWDSGDRSEDAVKHALASYRGIAAETTEAASSS